MIPFDALSGSQSQIPSLTEESQPVVDVINAYEVQYNVLMGFAMHRLFCLLPGFLQLEGNEYSKVACYCFI